MSLKAIGPNSPHLSLFAERLPGTKLVINPFENAAADCGGRQLPISLWHESQAKA